MSITTSDYYRNGSGARMFYVLNNSTGETVHFKENGSGWQSGMQVFPTLHDAVKAAEEYFKFRHVNYLDLDINFKDGFMITKPQTLIDGYRWDGTLPKVVPPGSTIESTGGIGVGCWIRN